MNPAVTSNLSRLRNIDPGFFNLFQFRIRHESKHPSQLLVLMLVQQGETDINYFAYRADYNGMQHLLTNTLTLRFQLPVTVVINFTSFGVGKLDCRPGCIDADRFTFDQPMIVT